MRASVSECAKLVHKDLILGHDTRLDDHWGVFYHEL